MEIKRQFLKSYNKFPSVVQTQEGLNTPQIFKGETCRSTK